MSDSLSAPVDAIMPLNVWWCLKHGAMYHAFFVLKPNVFPQFGFLSINISDTGGAMGVALKFNFPSVAAHADRRGFCLHFLTMLTLNSIWGRSLHQYAMGKVGGRDSIVDFTHDL